MQPTSSAKVFGIDDLRCLSFPDAGPDASLRLAQNVIVPKPVYLLSTLSQRGVANVAPYSYVCPVATVPATLAISFLRKADGSEKDTLVNLRASRQVVVNGVHESILVAANACAQSVSAEQSEFSLYGLTPLFGPTSSAPHVGESLFRLECELETEVPIGGSASGCATLVVVRVVRAFMPPELLDGDRAWDVEPLGFVGRCGMDRYLVADGFFTLARPDTGESTNVTRTP